MATNINLQTEKPKIIELNFEDMKAEEELLNYVTYPTTDEHLWLACAVYLDRLATGRKSWTDELIVYLNVPSIVQSEPLMNADTTLGVPLGLLADLFSVSQVNMEFALPLEDDLKSLVHLNVRDNCAMVYMNKNLYPNETDRFYKNLLIEDYKQALKDYNKVAQLILVVSAGAMMSRDQSHFHENYCTSAMSIADHIKFFRTCGIETFYEWCCNEMMNFQNVFKTVDEFRAEMKSLMEDNPELLQFDPRYIFMKEMLSRSLPNGIYDDQDQEQDDPSEGEQDTEDFD